MRRATVEAERPLVIRAYDINTRVEVFRTAILSIDPNGQRYPTLLRCLVAHPQPEDEQRLLAEARAVRQQLPRMRFQLQRGDTLFTTILVETPLLRRLHRLLLSTAEQPPRTVPIQERIKSYLDHLVD